MKIGFIDYYLDEFHANKYPGWIRDISGGDMRVAYAYAVKDKEGGVSNAEWCANQGVEWIDSIESLVELSDAIVVLAPDHPEHHEALSELPLRSGKPTYIDKTFAPDRVSAERMFELAAFHGTPMYSTSALRFASEYAVIDRQCIHAISSWGPGALANYAIHQIEPIVSLMGAKPKRLMFTGSSSAPAIWIDYGAGRQATVQHFGPESPFMMNVLIGSEASQSSQVIKVESDFFQAFIENLIEFFRSGKPAVAPEETLAVISIIEQGLKAAEKPFHWFDL